MPTHSAASPPSASDGVPRQIAYIIGNEGCERFSFYGMRNILTAFLVSSLLVHLPEPERPDAAKEVFHSFVIGVYFFPLLGGWLADRVLGKYATIFRLSLLYCGGHLCLALFDANRTGFYAGLALIAIGSGGIKPCVSAFVGDQFDQRNKHRAKGVFDAFYWIINFGSFFASLLMPVCLRAYGPSVAFGIPGLLMLVATVVFWLGRRQYVLVAPSPPDPHGFAQVARTALMSRARGRVFAAAAAAMVLVSLAMMPRAGVVISLCSALAGVVAVGGVGVWCELEGARGTHPDEAVEGVRSVLRLLLLFMLVTPFWSLFDQKASTWVLQADAMTKPAWFASSQMQALNPALVMLLIPFNHLVLYPFLGRMGFEMTALRRMTAGIALAGLAWICVGALQATLDAGAAVSIVWQVLPYAVLTLGEVLVSATGLEFAYSQAPPSMKGAIMSFWSLSVTFGNLWVLIVNAGVRNETVTSWIAASGFGVTAFQMFFFAAFAFVAAAVFGLVARRYPLADHYRNV